MMHEMAEANRIFIDSYNEEKVAIQKMTTEQLMQRIAEHKKKIIEQKARIQAITDKG